MQASCTQCGSQFEIQDQDKAFYKEIDVPGPTLCPPCRSQARCVHRNERSLYKRTCDLCKREIVAMYPKEAPFPVYCQECFFSDKWNAEDFGQEFLEDQPFFEQFRTLLNKVPHLNIINKQSQNSEYCNYAYSQKNCYLTWGSHYEEDCLHDAYSTKNKDSMDFLWMYGSELMYECMFGKNCYHSMFLDHCEECQDCYFSHDLKGCKNCLFCANLHQKEFHIFNEPCSKEEFESKLKELSLHTHKGLQEARRQFLEVLPQKFPARSHYIVQCENCIGDTMNNCKNMRYCFFCADSEDCTYGCQIDGTYSSMDMDYMGYDRSDRLYQTIGCLGLFDCIGCNACWNGGPLKYCQFCYSCADCFGCASLHQKTHCILNKEYSKEEYENLNAKIKEQMKSEGTWGTFFPAELTPFAYNESMAIDWFPLSKEEAAARGLRWKEGDEIPEVEKVIPAEQLPDSIDDIPDDVLNWAITCEVSKRPFLIVKQELAFYRKMRLPVPHFHPEERHKMRLERRNPRMLWLRKCGKCEKEIQTTYSPERPETVYCEECYLKEVY